jgi:hypothetical protein
MLAHLQNLIHFNSLHLVQKYIIWDKMPADKINIWLWKYTNPSS